jgi:hypothetical protein
MIVEQAGTLRQNDSVVIHIPTIMNNICGGAEFLAQICKTMCLFSDIFFQHSRTVLQMPVTVYFNMAILSNFFPICDIYTTKKKPDKKMHASAWQS